MAVLPPSNVQLVRPALDSVLFSSSIRNAAVRFSVASSTVELHVNWQLAQVALLITEVFSMKNAAAWKPCPPVNEQFWKFTLSQLLLASTSTEFSVALLNV